MTYQRNILITGATDGLGVALAHYYRGRGERPLLLGRVPWADLPHLTETLSPDDYCQIDPILPDGVARAEAFLQERGIHRLDLIIHRPDTLPRAGLAEQTPESIDDLLTVNLYAPLALTQALLPWLPTRQGQVTFIGAADESAAVNAVVLAASQGAMAGLARGLQREWRGQLTAQFIQPGAASQAEEIARAIASKRPFVALAPFHHPPAYPTTQPANHPVAHPPTCLITGAAKGLGKALAWRFARAGYTIIGLDVAAEAALDGVAELGELGGEPTFILADLGAAEGVETAVTQLLAAPPIDVIIHCAARRAAVPFGQLLPEQQRQVLDVNLRAPLQLTAALARNGRFPANATHVFLASLANFVGHPGAALDAASNMGVAAYAHSLRAALEPTAFVFTFYPSEAARRSAPDAIAEAIFQATQKRRPADLIPGPGNRVLALGGRLPGGLLNGITL